MAVKNYDPKKVSVIFGAQPMSGFAEGTFVKVARDEDTFSLKVGADGESCRVKNNNRAGKVTLTLLESSSSNEYLSALQVADELSGNSPFGLLIKDNQGKSLFTAVTAWIVKQPEVEFGKELSQREWVIQTDELITFTGGN